MRKAFILSAIIVVAFAGSTVQAVGQDLLLTNDQVERIRNNCADTQISLTAVHNTDAAARVNLGEQFNAVSNRLMAPMNSRIALNKLNGVALATTTVAFNEELKNLSLVYIDYEKALSGVIAMKCYDQPIEFYDNLTLAMQKRAAVRSSVSKLTKLMEQYRVQVGDLQKQALTGVSNG